MIRFAPRVLLPADEERREREKIAKKRPHLALDPMPQPHPDHFKWWAIEDLIGRKN
jgi:hypothetical protein